MNQILTIFKKDARHLWPEILASIIITAALVRIYPNTWLPMRDRTIILSQISSALIFFVPLSWWLLITRLIQSESLVGDRQFWLTRPYEWQKLLAAKAFFLLVFLYIPTLLAHGTLLVEAGFQPFAYLPGLIYNLLLLTGVVVFPLAVIAVITSTFIRATLTALGILISIICLAFFSSKGPSANTDTPGQGIFFFLLFCGIMVTVIVLQYATRRIWLSRGILYAFVIFGVLSAIAYPDAAAVHLVYPPASGPESLHLSFNSTAVPEVITPSSDITNLVIPLQISGIPAGRVISQDNVRVSIDAPNGLHWQSHWQSTYNRIYRETTSFWISISVDRDFINKVRTLPLTLHVDLAFSELEVGQPVTTLVRPGDFAVPGIGICTLPDREPEDSDYYFNRNVLNCRSALSSPQRSHVQTNLSNLPCSSSLTPVASGDEWIGTLNPGLADLSLAPVSTQFINISNPPDQQNQPPSPGQRKVWRLCPGTPLTITPYHVADRTQVGITINEVYLNQSL